MVQTTDNKAKETEPLLEKFERFEKQTKQPAWVFPLRRAGIARFAELGFPTLHDEDWRFTNVAPIAKLPVKPLFELVPDGIDAETVAGLTFGSLPATRLVFVNGRFMAELSTDLAANHGLRIENLAHALPGDSGRIEKYLARHTRDEINAFTALNTAFFQDGALVEISAGVEVERPIHLLFISTSKETGATTQPRNLIIARKNSRATVLESYASTVDASYFTNVVTEMVLEEGAQLEHCKFQNESHRAFHVATIGEIEIGRAPV